ncbi:MAG: hypothetical protein R6U64_10055 [Bacteroidales bacterium]
MTQKKGISTDFHSIAGLFTALLSSYGWGWGGFFSPFRSALKWLRRGVFDGLNPILLVQYGR